MKIVPPILFVAIMLSACGGSDNALNAAVGAPPQTIVVAGDSLTRRTGMCLPEDTLASCVAGNRLDPLNSWPTYIADATSNAWQVIANEGRAGDTCTAQAAFVGGVFNGQPRGLINRLQAIIDAKPLRALVLIGINDVEGFGVSVEDTVACAKSVRTTLTNAGIATTLLTYGNIVDGNLLWHEGSGAKLDALNDALVAAGAVRLVPWPRWSAYVMLYDGVHTNSAGAALFASQTAALALGVKN